MHSSAISEPETLLTVVHTGSISKAARGLGANQQTMSIRIAQAEKALGIAVFERSPYGISPTEKRQMLVDALPDFLVVCHRSSGIAASLRPDNVSRHLILAASSTVAEFYYPGWATEFHRQHPIVKLSMAQANSREVQQLVADSAMDFGLIEGETGQHDLEERIIDIDGLVLVMPTGHPWSERAAVYNAISVGGLRTTPLVIREPSSGSRKVVEDTLGTLTGPAGEFGSPSAQCADMIVLASPAIIARDAVRDQVAFGRTVIVPTDTAFARSPSVVMHRGSEASRDISEFIRIANPILSKHERPQ